MKLTCPIRGILNVEDKAKDGLTFSEEKRRIDLIRFLIERGYKKENIILEDMVKIGNSGRNSIRIDLIVKNEKNKTSIVSEVKRDSKDIVSAINNQLIPAMKLKNAEYAIYWDGSNNKLFHYDAEKEFPISKLPRNGQNFESVNIKFENLITIKDSKNLYDSLELLIHNLGSSLEERYSGLFQVILAKYYDEQFNKENLKFISNVSNLVLFKELWAEAYEYYTNTTADKLKIKKGLVFSEETIFKIIETLEPYSFTKSSSSVAQDFFMKFGSKVLQKDLAQFYTPIPIVDFIVSLLDIKPNNFVIDPAGGSADFLAGILQKYKNKPNYDELRNCMFYWDLSPDAANVAFLNMVLNGDGRTKLEVLDSIEKWNKDNGKFNFVITNPPFGSKVKWAKDIKVMDNYKLSKHAKDKKQELGILFIERSMNLLKDGGIMAIILPSGYLNNKTTNYIREYLINNFRIVADISMPDGAFKGANTGVKTDLLVVKKQKVDGDYKIFVDTAKKIGFDYSTKSLPTIFKKDEENGKYLLDENNDLIVDSDFTEIAKKFKKFVSDEMISGFEKHDVDIDYSFFLTSELDETLKIKPEMKKAEIDKMMNDKNLISLGQLKLLDSELVIENSTQRMKSSIKDSEIYSYISIAEAGRGTYSIENKMRGWEVKSIDRAKQLASKDSIYISYLLGSSNTFFYFASNKKNVVTTSGFYRVWIKDERVRLSFYKFLFSPDFKKQFEAFATGHIQTNIVQERILDFKFALISNDEMNEVRDLIKHIDQLNDFKQH